MLGKILGIDYRGIDVGENLELVGTAHIVAIGRGAVGNDPPLTILAHLPGLKRLDHLLFLRHTANPLIGFNTHCSPPHNTRLAF